MLHERCDTNNCVVSPVMRLAQLPEMQSCREQRSVQTTGKLLYSRVERFAAGGDRGGLDDAGFGVCFHELHKASEALAAHDAVSVQHYHVAIIFPPAAAEVGDVAALALNAMLATAVENVSEAIDSLA